jgi:hypothetical protein
MFSKKILWFFIFSMAWHFAMSQDGRKPEISDTIKWETAQDYNRDRDLIVKCLKWLCTAPMGQDVIYRSEANAFVLRWLAGSPDVIIDIDEAIFDFTEENDEILFSVIHAMALTTMTKKKDMDKEKLAVETMRIVCELVDSSEKYSADKKMKAVLKAYRRDKLEDYVRERMQLAKK